MTDKKMSGKTHPQLGELTVDEHWILHCAVNDINWKIHLEKLTLEEVDRLLTVETRKTAIRKLQSRRRRLERTQAARLGSSTQSLDENQMKNAIEVTGLTKEHIKDILQYPHKYIMGVKKENREVREIAEGVLVKIKKTKLSEKEAKKLLEEMTDRFIKLTKSLDSTLDLVRVLLIKNKRLEMKQK